MDDAQRQQLDHDGYVVLPQLLSHEQINQLTTRLDELLAEEGERAGEENYIERNAQRLANLVNKGDMFRSIFRDPRVLDAVAAVIGPNIRLNMMNARNVPPRSDPRQPLHTDTDHGAKADDTGYFVATAIWMLDDFTVENGATHFVPGSHRSGKNPKEVLADVYAPHPDEIRVVGKAGDVFVFNGHAWHAGGENKTDAPRRALLVHYIRSDHSQRLNQKQSLSPEVQQHMNPREREILGLDD